MVWTEDEKQILEEYRSLIESDPKKAIDLIIKNHNGPEWRSSGRIIFSLLLKFLNNKIFLLLLNRLSFTFGNELYLLKNKSGLA